jgi:hypothetical protein
MAILSPHPGYAKLLDYWLHDSDAALTDAVDEHLMSCDECGHRLDEIAALGDAVRAAFRAGRVAAVTSRPFLEQLAAEGLQLRIYRLPVNASVNCTVAPDDDLLVSRLQVNAAGVTRIDLLAELTTEPGVQRRLEDIPFDPDSGEVVVVENIVRVRARPVSTMQVTLLAMEQGGPRELGRYTFHHRP